MIIGQTLFKLKTPQPPKKPKQPSHPPSEHHYRALEEPEVTDVIDDAVFYSSKEKNMLGGFGWNVAIIDMIVTRKYLRV